jgi:hypothetical protein
MTETIAPEFSRFVTAERRARRIPAAPGPLTSGKPTKPVRVDEKKASELLRVAARRAAGLFHPTTHEEVIWVEGDSELAVSLKRLEVKLTEGLIHVLLPVRCDQIDAAVIEVVFAVGAADQPAGLFASTYRLPIGPPLIVQAWGPALVAFAWQCVLGLVSGLAGAIGKDERGNVLVPAELTAARGRLSIVPMARHRFSGSSGLR